ncbi:RagB/SusD family nutrient uptake outer membrane protein [Reichenbachiella sp. MSK19-1]|uniref:RagB/SusD family nutrient uptake outer membrane protein n=1 Tax=Reichenbachiella sp. MSK19-1 TaxID=1897631 RepID=UPI000E6BC5AD|nr:RagB/SusD family nutrient uptake outer membrane protein [Reichenbachiella sp. MSK19-1]RJE73973.1 hypothetical protein BGP76_12255 [Reichenbachiella sp. MSK19-1]
MKNYIKISMVVVLTIIYGCQDKFLELDPLDSVTESVYFETPEHFDAAANSLYTQLIGLQKVKGSGLSNDYQVGYADFMDFGTDLIAFVQDEGRGSLIVPEQDKYWSNWYYWLRDVNMILKKADEYDGNVEDIEQPIGTAYFFRAWHHFLLLQRFGGVPIVTSVLDLDSPELSGPRNSRYEVIAQVLSDLDVAIDLLPTEQQLDAGDKGKISRWGAEAFKAEVLLYEATWEKYVGTTTDGDGVNTGAGSAMPDNYPSTGDMLTEAIALSKDVMDNGGYELWNHNTELDSMSSYYLFNLEDGDSNPAGLDKSTNNEFIIQGIYDFVLRRGGVNISHVVDGRTAPSRKFMDMFLCVDGLPVDKSTEFQGYYTVSDEFENRDFRMNAYYYGVPEGGSPALSPPTSEGNPTGILGQKFRSWNYPTYRNVNEESFNFPLLRLAEVYLIYAESLFELNGTITDAQLDESINKIRERAGVADLTNALVSNYNLDMLEEIRRERAVELFLENSRYNDLKRWGIAEQELNAPILGAIVEGTLYEADGSLYDPSVYIYGEQEVENGTGSLLRATVIDPASNRSFDRKDYLFPLPTAQLNLNKALTQNPEW